MAYIGQKLGYNKIERYIYTASGGETEITNADDGRTIYYDASSVDVYLNGSKLVKGEDFSAPNESSIIVSPALDVDDVLEVVTVTVLNLASATSGASGGGTNAVFWENDISVTTDYTITSGRNAVTAGPITVEDGVVITIPDGSVWTIV